MENKEEWRAVPGFEGLYEASNMGQIRKTVSKDLMRLYPTGHHYKEENHYQQVALWKDEKRKQISVHRLIGLTFLGDIEGRQINHKNGIKNDNRVENLEICTASENINHSYYVLENLIKPVTSICIKTAEQKEYRSICDAVRDGNVSSHIHRCLRGKGRSHNGKMWIYSENIPPSVEALTIRVTELEGMVQHWHGMYERERGICDQRGLDLAASEARNKMPDGYVLVPIEPTEEMLNAARFYHKELPYTLATCYRAMLQSAPSSGDMSGEQSNG